MCIECVSRKERKINMMNNEEKVNELTVKYEGYEVVSFCKRISRTSHKRVIIEITLEPVEDADPE